ncbi:MAG: calcium/sodium antiporter [Caldithrix sp.]|nr:calcium/sodium antiporter [Caldithrix sp.]
MTIIINSVILISSVFALWWGAVWVVESASRIAHRIGVSELVIGLTVVAFGTSAPEFAVTLTAAFRDQADISVGNVVGSNIFNLGFIMGGVAFLRSIVTSKRLVFRDGFILIGVTIFLLIFLYDHRLMWWEGSILMASLIFYLTFLFIKKEPIEEEVPTGAFRWTDIPMLFAGLILILAGGHFLVDSASSLARLMGISDWVIAVTIVAAGTSTPELATSLVAVIKGKHGISAGNLIGSDLFNLMGVLGLAGILRPMQVTEGAYNDILVLSAMVILVVMMMRTGWKISRWEGALLILINLVRWIINFYQ